MDFAAGPGGGDAGADLQHVRTEAACSGGVEVVGVVLHEGAAPAAAAAHHFKRAHEGGVLPVALGSEAVALRHQPLNRQAGELSQAVQVLEGVGKRAIAAGFEEAAQAGLDAGGLAQGVVALAAGSQIRIEVVAVGILGAERVNLGIAAVPDDLREITDAVGIDRDPEDAFGLDLVALGHGYLAHIVAEAHDLERAHLLPGEGHGGPGGQAAAHPGVFPVADDHPAGDAHPGEHMAELAPAVGGLVQVHEVHIDRLPGDVAVELGVQVADRFFQLVESADPHFRGRKGVHPADQPGAGGVAVGFEAGRADLVGGGHDGLEDDADGHVGVGVQSAGEGRGVGRHLLEGFGAVEVLAAGQKPEFGGGGVVHGLGRRG